MTDVNYSTICAISTCLGVGGISIIRMSGKDAIKIATKVFYTDECEVKKFQPRKMYLGFFKIGNVREKCFCVYFKGPKSYTGEDIVEFQCHGGVLIANKILDTLIDNGSELASAGEFTKRSFLNGKISLDEAEGVIDIINAESESELTAGYNLLDGNLNIEINKLQTSLTEILSKLEVVLDYPDEDLEEETKIDVLEEIDKILKDLKRVIETNSTGKFLKEGINVALIGKSNVGKSSLLNSLLNFNRAIVTNIEGTTRDTLEETYVYKGVKFNIIDTAGIRASNDYIENIGISKAKDSIRKADLILFIIDASEKPNNEDVEIHKQLCDKKYIVCVNKCDLLDKFEKYKYFSNEDKMFISAKNKTNIEELKEKIFNNIIDSKVLSGNIILTNKRHVQALQKAVESLKQALQKIKEGATFDLIVFDIKEAWLYLGEVTGKVQNEEIINNIFAKFCVGK